MSERLNFAERVCFVNKIDELQAENAHLRKSVQNAEHEESVAWDMVRIAERRNVKLRELVRDMVDWAYISDYCDLEEQFADRMRELGIEVG